VLDQQSGILSRSEGLAHLIRNSVHVLRVTVFWPRIVKLLGMLWPGSWEEDALCSWKRPRFYAREAKSDIPAPVLTRNSVYNEAKSAQRGLRALLRVGGRERNTGMYRFSLVSVG